MSYIRFFLILKAVKGHASNILLENQTGKKDNLQLNKNVRHTLILVSITFFSVYSGRRYAKGLILPTF